MKKADLISGCFLLVFSGYVVWESLRMPPSATYGPGAGFLPFWVGIILAGLSVLLLLRAWLQNPRPGAPSVFPGGGALMRVCLVLLGLGLYAVFMEWLGFLMNTLLFVAFLMGAVQREGVKLTAAVAVLTTLGLYVIFQVLLGITLPRGPFGF